MAGQMVAEARDDQRRNLDRAPTSRRLRRAKEKLAPVGLGQRPGHLDGASIEVDVPTGERGELAPPQAGEGSQKYEGLVAGADGRGELVDLLDGQDRPLG
jgi:hypothetical protein